MLNKNQVSINGKKTNDTRIYGILKQRPNSNVLGYKFYLGLYNWGNPEKEKGIKKWFTKIGEAPIIIDSTLTEKSAKQVGMYLFGQGYFNNYFFYETKRKRFNKKKGRNYFYYYTGPRFYVRNYTYSINSKNLEELYLKYQKSSWVVEGMGYNVDSIEAERNRLVTMFRNSGFIQFPANLIRYEADTNIDGNLVDLKLIISDIPVQSGDSIIYKPHKPAKIINLDVYSSKAKDENPAFQDSLLYGGYTMRHHTEATYDPFFISRTLSVENGYLYREVDVNQSYSTISNTRIFKSSEINFSKVSEDDSTIYLKADIKLNPFKKRTFNTELEVTNTAGNYGFGASVSWLERNIFNAGEIFEFRINGALEAQVSSGDFNTLFNTYELGAEMSLKIPRLWLFSRRVNQKIPKRKEPETKIFMSVTTQNRIEFERLLYKTGLEYKWKESPSKKHAIAPFDISYVSVLELDTSYLGSLDFVNTFQDNLITNTRYTFTYNDQYKNERNNDFFRGSFEIGGNLLAALGNVIDYEVSSEFPNQKKILDVPFAQYFKVDADYRHYVNFRYKQAIVTRAFGGLSYGFGNTPYTPPFEKQFFVGGSNDMRAWQAYKLGPGSTPSSGNVTTGTIKLMVNMEYRFPLFKKIEGALFVDAGNVWYMKKDIGFLDDPDFNLTEGQKERLKEVMVISGGNILKQIAVGPGVGFRYDFSFFIFRVDMATQLYNPQKVEIADENPWLEVSKLQWRDIRFNFALGYPF